MKTLSKSFTLKGFQYKQVARDGMVAVYEQKSKTGALHWEVVLIQKHEGFINPQGFKVEAAETYPKRNHWGRLGWTCTTKQRAFDKMGEILESKDKQECHF